MIRTKKLLKKVLWRPAFKYLGNMVVLFAIIAIITGSAFYAGLQANMQALGRFESHVIEIKMGIAQINHKLDNRSESEEQLVDALNVIVLSHELKLDVLRGSVIELGIALEMVSEQMFGK